VRRVAALSVTEMGDMGAVHPGDRIIVRPGAVGGPRAGRLDSNLERNRLNFVEVEQSST
jgi:hypothetical protein